MPADGLATDDALEMMTVGLMEFPLVGHLISTLGEDPGALDELKADTQGYLDSHGIDLSAAEFHQVMPLIVDNLSTQYDQAAGLSPPEAGLSPLDHMVNAVSDYYHEAPAADGGLDPGLLAEHHFDPLFGAESSSGAVPSEHPVDPTDGVDHGDLDHAGVDHAGVDHAGVDHSAFGYEHLASHLSALQDGGAGHVTYGAGSGNGAEYLAAQSNVAVGAEETADGQLAGADVQHAPEVAHEATDEAEHHLDTTEDAHHDQIQDDHHHVDPLLGGEHGGPVF